MARKFDSFFQPGKPAVIPRSNTPAPTGFPIDGLMVDARRGVFAIPNATMFQKQELGKGLSGWSGIVPFRMTFPKLLS